MAKLRRKGSGKKIAGNVARGLLCACVALAAGAAFAIEGFGGTHGIPTWGQVYSAFGIETNVPETNAADGTVVTVLDVGQGSAALIAQDGEYCLIDAGPAETKTLLANDLRALGVKKLKLMVLTHPHSDHIGGAAEVLDCFEVEQLLLTSLTYEEEGSGWQERILATAQRDGVEMTVAQAGQTYPVGSGTLTVLQANFTDTGDVTADDSMNDTSICTMFTAGDFRYLSTGDAEANAENALLQQYGDALRATVLTAGHHGSYTSSTQQLLQKVRPQAVAISCGAGNDYGHPHDVTLRRISSVGAEIYRTDTMGSISFSSTQDGLQVAVSAPEQAEVTEQQAA